MKDPLPGWPRALSAELAAAYVGLSKSTILRLQGFPKPVNPVPGRNVWLKEDLDTWLDKIAGREEPDGWLKYE